MKKIKLDLLDRHILLELDKNSRIPITELSKKLQRSRETILYRINNLMKKGIIKKFKTVIDPSKLGYSLYRIYAQLENNIEKKEELLKNLKSSDHIYWIGLCDGAGDMIFVFFTRNNLTFYNLKNKLLLIYRSLMIKDVVSLHVESYRFSSKYLLNDCEATVTKCIGPPEYNEIDEIDKKILNTLSSEARIPFIELAKRVNSTEGIVKKKMTHMEEKKIIAKYGTFIDLSKLGLAFFKANIYFSDLTDKREMALVEYLKIHPRVINYIKIIGPWSAEIEIVAENINDFTSIINKIKSDFSDIIKHHEINLINWEDRFPGGIFNKNASQNI